MGGRRGIALVLPGRGGPGLVGGVVVVVVFKMCDTEQSRGGGEGVTQSAWSRAGRKPAGVL